MKNSLQTLVVLLLLITVAFCFRLPLLSGSFWLDEAAQALESARPTSQQFQIVDDFQPPLLHLVVHALLTVSKQEWWLRLGGAVLPGIATIVLAWFISRRYTTGLTAVVPSLLLSVHSLHIFFSQELRPYSLPVFFTALSWFLLLAHKKQLMPLVLLACVTAMGWYSSFLYPFVVLGQFVYVALQKSTNRQSYVTALLAGSATFVFWLPMLRAQFAAGALVRSGLPGWQEIVGIPPVKSLLLVWGKFLFGVVDLEPNIFFVGLSGIVIAIASLLLATVMRSTVFKNKFPDTVRTLMLLSISWVLVPLTAVWLVSWFVPILQPKRVLFVLPGVYIAGVMLWQLAVEVAQKKTKAFVSNSGKLLFVLLFAISLSGTAQYYLHPQLQRENWRSLHAEILGNYPTETIAVFSFPAPFAPWVWYDDGLYPTITTGALSTAAVPDLQSRLRPVLEYRTVLVFDYLRDLSDPDDEISLALQSFGFTEVTSLSRPGIGQVHVWSRYADRISYYRM